MGKGGRGDWPLGSRVAEEKRRGGDGKEDGEERRERWEVDRLLLKGTAVKVHRRCS